MFKSELALSLLNTLLNIKKSCPKAAPYLFFNQAFIGIMTAPSGRIISGVQVNGPKPVGVRQRRSGDEPANRPTPILQQTTGKGGFSHTPLPPEDDMLRR